MSAGSLEILPKLLDTDYVDNKDLIGVGLDCMFKVIDLDIKYEECFKIWADNRAIERLAIILLNVINDPSDTSLLTKVAQMFLNFCMASKEVKLKVCEPQILEIVLRCIESIKESELGKFVKAFKYLT
jgi:hypothetical protein